jgi:uncharacterized membrane protein
MKLTPAEVWSELRSTYWFVPSLMTAAAIALAVVFQRIDRGLDGSPEWIFGLRMLYPDSPEGARALLGAIVGSIVTVVSVTFSITIVALTVASQHYGPRLLNTFMRDLHVQIVLGIFVGTFAYSVLVLGAVRGVGQGDVPHLSSLGSVVLVLISVGALIYFIHHISSQMGVPAIASRIADEFVEALNGAYAEHLESGALRDADAVPTTPPGLLLSRETGYVQRIDEPALCALAAEADALFRLRGHPGEFVVAGAPLLEVHPREALDDALTLQVNRLYVFGLDRTMRHDPESGLKQLVEIALHALSPSLNEPFTAIACIDRLGECLAAVARQPPPARVRADAAGRPRLIADRQTFETMLRASFDPIRLSTTANPAVPVRLLDTIAQLSGVVIRDDDREALRHQAEVIRRWAVRQTAEPDDAAFLEQRYRRAVEQLGRAPDDAFTDVMPR